MTDVVDETEDGRMRAVVEQDIWADNPDSDTYGYVFMVDGARSYPRRVEVLHAPIGDPFADEMAADMSRALERFGYRMPQEPAK